MWHFGPSLTWVRVFSSVYVSTSSYPRETGSIEHKMEKKNYTTNSTNISAINSVSYSLLYTTHLLSTLDVPLGLFMPSLVANVAASTRKPAANSPLNTTDTPEVPTLITGTPKAVCRRWRQVHKIWHGERWLTTSNTNSLYITHHQSEAVSH